MQVLMARTKAGLKVKGRFKLPHEHRTKVNRSGVATFISTYKATFRVYEMLDPNGVEMLVACIHSPALAEQVLFLTPEPLTGGAKLAIALDPHNAPFLADKPAKPTMRLKLPLQEVAAWLPKDHNVLSITSAKITQGQWETAKKKCREGTTFRLSVFFFLFLFFLVFEYFCRVCLRL
jgi:hypothetical protein